MKTLSLVVDWALGALPQMSFVTTESDEELSMTWDYRVIYIPAEDETNIDQFEIREVYYDADDEVVWWSENAASAFGETFEQLCTDADLITEAFEKPLLMLVGDELIELEDEDEEEEEI